MSTGPRLTSLLLRYEELRERGVDVSPESLCRDCPELLSQFKQQLDSLSSINNLLERTSPTIASSGPPSFQCPRIPGYEIIEELGRGGMGVVFKARQLKANRLVALKMVLAGELAGATAQLRFRAEAEAAANLDHPNIVPIYEIGEFEGRMYFSMKLIEGASLAQVKPRDRRDEVRIVAQIARAVHHAHQRGIIHRDLKPSNILLDTNEKDQARPNVPHLTDFGVAKRIDGASAITCSGTVIGTPSYMAPEQAEGRRDGVTTAADIYSLGAILYELLTGRPPFCGETALETLRLVREGAPVPPTQVNRSIDRDLETICLKCLDREPNQRFSSAAALADDLEHWLAGEPIAARPASAQRLIWLWLRKHLRTAIIAVASGLVCGGLGTALLSLLTVWILFVGAGETYKYFPGRAPPLFAPTWTPPAWLLGAAWLAGFAVNASMGLITARLLRTKNHSADLLAGLASGGAAAFGAFTFGVGWSLIVTLVVINTMEDTELFRQATIREQTTTIDWAEVIAEKYPNLRNETPEKRVHLFSRRIRAEQALASLLALWIGVFFCLFGYLAVGVIQTMGAGYLLRSRQRFWSVPGPYLELTLPPQLLLVAALRGVLYLAAPESFPFNDSYWVLLGFSLLAIPISVLGVFRDWPWLLRCWLYVWLAQLACRIASSLGMGSSNPWQLDVAAWIVTFVVAVYYAGRRRRATGV
jgi:eukaryotic-like serine/threonine-protein kinase